MSLLLKATFLISLLGIMTQARAADITPIPLDPAKGANLVGPHSQVLIDPTRELDLNAAMKAWDAGQFQQETAKDPNYGFTGHAYWYRFSAQNMAPLAKEWFFGLEYPLVNHIDLYYQGPDGQWVHRKAGNAYEFEQRDLKSRFIYLKVDFAPQEQKHFFLRLQTDGSSEFRMTFKDLKTIARADHDIQFYLGICLGLPLIMAGYYFVMMLNTRKSDVTWLCIFLFSLFIFRMAINGFAYEYLWPNAPDLAHAVVALSVPLVFFTALTTTAAFLPIDNYPRFRLIIRIFAALNGACVLFSFVLPYRMLKVYTLLGITTAALIIVTSVYSQLKGFRPARYFVYAWSAMVVGSITFGLQKLGLLPVSFLGTYGPEIATVMQTILLALGVSDKINETNRQLQIAQADALTAQIETNRLQEVMNTQLEVQVQQRTEELWKQSKGMSVMLDNINQGICTVDGELRVQPQHSKRLGDILGTTDLEGRALTQLLFEHCELGQEQRDIVHSTVSASIGSDAMQLEINDHLLPRLLHFQQREPRILELDWAGIEDKDGIIDKLLVSIRDVTDIRKAEEAAAVKQQELEVIGKILDLSATKFRRFIKSSSVLLEEAKQRLDLDLSRESWQIVLRNVHTIKGNARTYRLLDISTIVHEVENDLFALNPDRITQESIAASLHGLGRIEKMIGFYQRIHDEKLKRGAVAETESLIVQASKMLTDVWPDLSPEKRRRYKQTLQRLDALNTNSFIKVIQPLVDSLPSLAQQLNKTPPEVQVSGADFFIEPDQLNYYEDVFVHMMRNSLDHGFMLGDVGRITIEVTHGRDQTEILYYDNGRGLNLPALRKKALEKGAMAKDADELTIARCIFVAGVSSARIVTEISGRGVGMDAVRGSIERLRGTIDLRLLGEANIPGYQRCEFRIILPPQNKALEALSIDEAA
ncbi:MAG TPA: 7TM diverse intracellular signaling domain-containing protein [Oligoflexus sp.]|uniref:7TM diverse intracellular signaling domain-containing protein n=1 Tax=Oligoflexus sp. TaxID=1971216 RepID=UPI002D34DD5C|nr:7TM diverse intracellular signaling domain-containing protein [Oligoflexus sp.]HYX31804.1 7TM diverse intracellular signaling domain-containing protein [Oligoflexus sp.]